MKELELRHSQKKTAMAVREMIIACWRVADPWLQQPGELSGPWPGLVKKRDQDIEARITEHWRDMLVEFYPHLLKEVE